MKTKRDAKGVAKEIADIREAWLKEWKPRLTSNEAPLSPYRVINDLYNTVDVANTIITHDAGSPRDQLSPFWQCTEPLTYIGWGKTTQLGYGLGLAMGAKLAHPDKLCINVWGDAAIGFTGMDFETCVRERIPIMSMLLNNFSMAIEIPIMPISQKKYKSTDISGDYAAMARAFGGYGERVTDPKEIIPAIKRGIAETKKGNAGAARVHHQEGNGDLALSGGGVNDARTLREPSPLLFIMPGLVPGILLGRHGSPLRSFSLTGFKRCVADGRGSVSSLTPFRERRGHDELAISSAVSMSWLRRPKRLVVCSSICENDGS